MSSHQMAAITDVSSKTVDDTVTVDCTDKAPGRISARHSFSGQTTDSCKLSLSSWFDNYIPVECLQPPKMRAYSCNVTKHNILDNKPKSDLIFVKGSNNKVSYSKDSDLVNITSDSLLEPSDLPKGKTLTKYGDLVVAATLIIDAKNGRHSQFKPDESSVSLYLLYHHWILKILLYFFVFVNLMLALFEKPAVDGLSLPYWVTIIIEIACLAFYLFRFFHGCMFIKPEVFWSDRKNQIFLATIIITIVDMIQYTAVINSSHNDYAIRFSRILRPIFLINIHEGRQIRRAFRNIRRTLPDILNVLLLFFLTIALFSLMGLKLYKKYNLKYSDGSPYFQNYFDIFFDLYVLVTTANNPDVMMPVYDINKWNSLFFITFIIIALYIFMSIILAVIYNNYRKHLKNEIKVAVIHKRKLLSDAFDILKVKEDDQYVISLEIFHALFKIISPKKSQTMVSILWFVLDGDHDGKIGKFDFLRLIDLLTVNLTEVKDRRTLLDMYFPTIYRSDVSIWLRKMVKHLYFRYFFDLLIMINAILIGLDINDAEWFFLGMFSLEIILKLYTFGLFGFFSRFWNKFDFVIIGSAVIGTIFEYILKDTIGQERTTLDIILVLRVLRLVKIVGGIERFKVVIVTIANLGPSIVSYGCILFIFYYAFSMVGMEVFQGKITYHGYSNFTDESQKYCGNPKLKDSDFYMERYCKNNFNNLISSMVLLFELTVVNQWHVLTSGFVLVTSKAARIYFFLFHLICVIIILNIFTAFILEAFIIEYSFCKGKLENVFDKTIHDLGIGLRPKTKRRRSRKVDKIELLECSDSSDDYSSGDEADHGKKNHKSGENECNGQEPPANQLPDLSKETDIRFHLSHRHKNLESMLHKMFENEINDLEVKVERSITFC
ncbi:TPCN3 (predicted) [Pycnogonum litorale]